MTMRICEAWPHVTVVYIDHLSAKVNVYWNEPAKIVIQQPKYYGGKIEYLMDKYDEFEGDLVAFVLHQREFQGGQNQEGVE